MQNVAIFAAVPSQSVQVVSDGKPVEKSGKGFLEQLIGKLTEQQGQLVSQQPQESVAATTQDGPDTEDSKAAAMNGMLAMLLFLPVHPMQPTVESPNETSSKTGQEQARLSLELIQQAETQPMIGLTGDDPAVSQQAELVKSIANGQDALVATEPGAVVDMPNDSACAAATVAGKLAWKPQAAVTTSSNKLVHSQASDMVAHLWKQSQIVRQQTTRQASSTGAAESVELEQAVSLPDAATALTVAGMQTEVVERPVPKSLAEVVADAAPQPVNADSGRGQASGDSRQADTNTLSKGPQIVPAQLTGQEEVQTGSKPAARFAETLKSVMETSVQQPKPQEPEPVPPEIDIAGFAGVKPLSTTDGVGNAHQSGIAHHQVKAWPSPHEQVLKGLESGIRQLQTTRAGERTTVKLQLFPEELGEVRVRLELVGRTVTAQFEASSTATANLLKDGLPILRQALDAQGFTDVSLTAGFTGSFAQAREGRDGNSPRHQARGNHVKMEQVVPEAAVRETQSKLADRRLDYKL